MLYICIDTTSFNMLYNINWELYHYETFLDYILCTLYIYCISIYLRLFEHLLISGIQVPAQWRSCGESKKKQSSNSLPSIRKLVGKEWKRDKHWFVQISPVPV